MYTVGEVITGVVDGIAEIGAFVELEDGRIGHLFRFKSAADSGVIRPPSERCDVISGEGA